MKVNNISLKQEGGQATEQVGAQPQQESVNPAIKQISDFISQAISQGQNPAEVVMSLVQQQVDQQTIGQALMMNGFEENDIMSLFEQMSQGQQPEEGAGGEPDTIGELNRSPEQLTEDERMHADDMSVKETDEPGMSLAKSGIEIKPENEGKFTRWAQARGMSVQEAANKVMSNTDEYPPAVVKMANFAKNAAGWNKEYGGESYQLGGVPQGKVGAVNNVNVKKDMNWQKAPLYMNPMEYEYSNDNFSLGKAAAVAYGGYKEFLSGDDVNNDGVKDGFFRGNNKKSMIPTGNNGQPIASMINEPVIPSIPGFVEGMGLVQPDSEFKYGGNLDKAQFGPPEWLSGTANQDQSFNSQNLNNFFKSMGQTNYALDTQAVADAQLGKQKPQLSTMQDYASEENGSDNDMGLRQSISSVSNLKPAGVTYSSMPTASLPPIVKRTNKFEDGLNSFMDSPGVQGYEKLSNFAVKGANVINDYFRDRNINKAREDNFNKLGADYQYATAEDPFNKRGMWDVNTGTAGSEGDRTTGLYMSKYGGENNTVNVDSNLLAKLIAAGADIEIL